MASKNLYFEYDSVYLKYSNGNRCKFRECYIFWHLAFSLNHIYLLKILHISILILNVVCVSIQSQYTDIREK
jgi:hypothetical protein